MIKKIVHIYRLWRHWDFMEAYTIPLIQFSKPCGLLFNEGGRWFTLSIGGTCLFFRLFFTIPFLKKDVEIMALRSLCVLNK